MSFRNLHPKPTSSLNRFLGNLLLLISIGLFSAMLSACSTVEVNEPGSHFDVAVEVVDTEASPFDGKVEVHMKFFQNGKRVLPSKAAHISCNGVQLRPNRKGHIARVPAVPEGGAYLFRHELQGLITEAILNPNGTELIASDQQAAFQSLEGKYAIGTQLIQPAVPLEELFSEAPQESNQLLSNR